MKIALVCPHFPPKLCGVGDYSARLASELKKQGHNVAVWTTASASSADVTVHTTPLPWNFSKLSRITKEISDFRPCVVLVQYTPQLYSPEWLGVYPTLPLWIAGLRKKTGAAIILNAHEVNYPVEASLRGLALGIPQFTQFLGMASCADRVFFTYEHALKRASRWLPWRQDKFSWASVGSNIEPKLNAGHAQKLRHEIGLSSDTKVLLHFGGAHPSRLFSHVFKAAQLIRDKYGHGNAALVFVGISSDKIKASLTSAGYSDLASMAYGVGPLPSEKVSEWLQACDLVLAPFIDGVSTRRGSVMAAFEHGKAVVTTKEWSSQGSVPWDQICAAVSARDEQTFAQAALSLLSSPERLQELGENGRAYYEKSFSWPLIAKKMSAAL